MNLCVLALAEVVILLLWPHCPCCVVEVWTSAGSGGEMETEEEVLGGFPGPWWFPVCGPLLRVPSHHFIIFKKLLLILQSDALRHQDTLQRTSWQGHQRSQSGLTLKWVPGNPVPSGARSQSIPGGIQIRSLETWRWTGTLVSPFCLDSEASQVVFVGSAKG